MVKQRYENHVVRQKCDVGELRGLRWGAIGARFFETHMAFQ